MYAHAADFKKSDPPRRASSPAPVYVPSHRVLPEPPRPVTSARRWQW